MQAQRVALVTGAGGGLGRAMALTLAGTGVQIVVADRVPEGGAETARLIVEAGGEGHFVQADVTDAAAVEQMVHSTVERYGRLDYAINNAGIDGRRTLTHECPDDQWHRTIAINLTGVWLCMKYELPQMLKQGSGVIVNVASVAGLVGYPGAAAYSASKHAVIGLTKSAALEYARQGIRINAICPGFTRTPMVERMFEGRPQLEGKLTEAMPLGRLGTPEDIAAAVLYLCSDSASFMIGHALVLDGGLVAQ